MDEEVSIKNNDDFNEENNITELQPNDEELKIVSRENLTDYFKKCDQSISNVYFSEVPQICKDEPCELGVDEAGRGPVLGPMVYGISYIPLSKKKLLVDLGCADSKSLTEAKRDEIFDKIGTKLDEMGWAIDVISPNIISTNMLKLTKVSLNEISMNSAISLIQGAINSGVKVAEVYVDTVGPPEKYQAKLKSIFPGIKIVVAKKADSTYPIVSAASICAKVSRDHSLRAWQFDEEDEENENKIGSGYPNDPDTKRWLTKNVDPIFGFPRIVRFSWSTASKILESEAIDVEWEEEEEEEIPQTQKISKFFNKSPQKSIKKHVKQHSFFTERNLSNTTEL